MNLETLYRNYFEELHRYAFNIVIDNQLAEDVVQDCFINFAMQIEKKVAIENPRAYLYKMVYHQSLSEKKRRPILLEMDTHVAEAIHESRKNILEQMISGEVQSERAATLDELLARMPDQCRTVFVKSKIDRKKYREIAQELNISEKTVEAHMSKAFKIIKEYIRVNRVSFALIISIISGGGNAL